MVKTAFTILVIVASIFVLTCAFPTDEGKESGSIVVSFSLDHLSPEQNGKALQKRALLVTSGRVTVSASDIKPKTVDLEVDLSRRTARAVIQEIKAGDTRQVKVELFDRHHHLTHMGEGTCRVIGGETCSVTIPMQTIPYPNIEISHSEIDFGSVPLDATVDDSLWIRNTGSATLEFDRLEFSGADLSAFSFSRDSGFKIFSGQTSHIHISFDPQKLGLHEIRLNLYCNDPDQDFLSITIKGTGIEKSEPDIEVYPETLSFGEVFVGEKVSLPCTIFNKGQANLILTDLNIQGAQTSAFSLPESMANVWLAPSDSQVVQVDFLPTTLATHNASLLLSSNDPDEPKVSISLIGTGTAVPVPDIEINPPEADFGSVLLETSDSLDIMISNRGSAQLRIDELNISEALSFSFSPMISVPLFLDAGESKIISVVFSPIETISYTAILQIKSNDPDEADKRITLKGSGQKAAEPNIDVDPGGLDFGMIRVDSSALAYIRIYNTGQEHLLISDLSIIGADSAAFDLDDTSPRNFILEPGENKIVLIVFAPLKEGYLSANLEIQSNDPGSPIFSVPLVGLAQQEHYSRIKVSTDTLSFKEVLVDDTKTLPLQIENQGQADLELELELEGNKAFSLQQSAARTISPGHNILVDIQFTPNYAGFAAGTLLIKSNDPDNPIIKIDLRGTGITNTESQINISPQTLVFSSLIVGSREEKSFKISNTGNAMLEITNLEVQGTLAQDFSLSSFTLPMNLPAGSSRTLFVTFQPLQAGMRMARIRIMSNDPNTPELDIDLQGEGLEKPVPDIQASSHKILFGKVFVGSSITKIVTLGNQGNAFLQISDLELEGNSAFSLLDQAPLKIHPDTSQDIRVRFRPLWIGDAAGKLKIMSNDPDNPELAIDLQGEGIEIPVPDIAINTNQLSFGPVDLSSFKTQFFNIRNQGNALLEISNLSLEGHRDFSLLDRAPIDVDAGSSQDVRIRFRPSQRGDAQASLEITSNDPDTPTRSLDLSGTGQAPQISWFPLSIDFGNINVGNQASQTITLRNQGNKALTVSDFSLRNSSSGFQIINSSTPLVIDVNSSHDLTIRFNPRDDREYNDILDVTHDDPTQTNVSIAVSGRGQSSFPFEMVEVPAGWFTMGDNDGREKEKPEHEVYLDRYWISKNEITVKEFVNFLNELNVNKELTIDLELGVYRQGREIFDLPDPGAQVIYDSRNDRFYAKSGLANRPIIEVTWWGADQFAKYYGCALPTEAQWEKAARGPEKRSYPWGNDPPSPWRANYDNNVGHLTDVGHYGSAGQSPYGCNDMAGNAWEWCQDWYEDDYYKTLPVQSDNPQGPATGRLKTVRGGNFVSDGWNTRTSVRYRYSMDEADGEIGMRIVKLNNNYQEGP